MYRFQVWHIARYDVCDLHRSLNFAKVMKYDGVGRRGMRPGIGTVVSHYVHTVRFSMTSDVFRRVRKIAYSYY